jgi:hypothetical protein
VEAEVEEEREWSAKLPTEAAGKREGGAEEDRGGDKRRSHDRPI